MNITKYEKRFLLIPVVLAALALFSIFFWGFRPGIDLAGGSLLQVSYPEGRPPVEQVRALTAKLGLGEVRVQPTDEDAYILRQRDLSVEEKRNLEAVLGGLGAVREDQYTSIGPTIGSELLKKAYLAVAAVIICIVLFIAFAFRKVSEPVSSWKYGVVAIVTLLFDALVPIGAYAYLGHFTGAEVDTLFIVALLAILGISINDKIVVFDRIRENLRLNAERHRREAFGEVVDRSITQTLARSINTSLTVVIVLLALYFFGPASTKAFALTLTVGMLVGTYSSIFFASPLLLMWERFSRPKK